MNFLVMLIIIGFILLAAFAAAICLEVYKSGKRVNDPLVIIPVFNNCPPKKISIQMMGFVRDGHFPMHTLKNKASKFDDAAQLEKYKANIHDPLVVTYIQNVKGWQDYE